MAGESLRILHTESSLGWGGQEIRVLTEARGVARRGNAVAIAAPEESRILQAAAGYGVEAIALPIARKSVQGLLALTGLLRGRQFDILNTHSSTDSWLASVAACLQRHPPPIVRTRHISAPVPRNFATRWLYRSATRRIVTTGERLRLQVIEETGVDPGHVVSIPTGIDLDRFRPGPAAQARADLGLAVDGRVIGIVATLRSWKGHRYLFEAFAGLADRQARLVVVGDGPQREALEALAKELAIEPRVTFAGNREDVAPWLRALDLFCLPSYANEGVPQALMQAMASGLPVISTPVGSIAEIVEDGVSGVLVPPEDANALRAAIESLLADGSRRARLATAAREAALRRFGEERMVERMLEIFTVVARAARG
ncbi:MAG TPA: glycosyltransferase [Usitatibacteraceae bacterium]|nr:glycosyltransferase [Burkholderiales bacterium]HQY46113.1 glycosyltransferase [Usitatibacteraceae bacterium]HRA22311.1 glycosyltransferase [Usitatibacteraceae bacterium]